MIGVIFKEDDNYRVIDPYFGGIWEFDRCGIEKYLKTAELIKKYEGNTEKMQSEIADRGLESVYDFVKEESMPTDTSFHHEKVDKILDGKNGILTPPEMILEVNRSCNYRCPWCYINDMKESDETLSLEEIFEKIIEPSLELGLKKWTLTGGEPSVTFHKTLSIARQIKESSKVRFSAEPEIEILSNGYNFKDYAKEYFDAGIKTVQFQLSSPIEKEEVELRRPRGGINSYEHVIDGVKKALEIGFFVSINMVVSPENNIHRIREMIALADSLGVNMLRITPVVMSGLAKDNGIKLDYENYKNISKFTREGIEALSPESKLQVYLPHFDLENNRPMRCGLGFIDFYIDHKGDVYPCNNLIEEQLKCDPGNVKDHHAMDIWYNSNMLNQFRKYLQNNVGEECGSCEKRGMCVGNCIARCWQRYGKFDLLIKPEICFKDI